MFKAVISNSFVTLVVFALSFLFKAYLTHRVAPNALISFYVFSDFIALVMRGFVGYKDCLVKLKQSNDKKEVELFFMQFKLAVIFFTALVLLPVYHLFFKNDLVGDVPYIYTFLSATTTMVSAYLLVRVTVEREYILMTLSEIVKFIFYASSLFFLLHFSTEDMDSMYIAFIISNLSVVVFLFSRTNKINLSDISHVFDKNLIFLGSSIDYYKNIFSSSMPYFIQGVFLFMPICFLVNFGEGDELANYQVVVRSFYFAMLAVFVYPLNRILLPEIFRFYEVKDWSMIIEIRNRVILASIAMLFLGFLICYYFLPILIPLLFDSYYSQSAFIVTIIFVSIPMQLVLGYTTAMIKATASFNIISCIYVSGIISMFLFSLLLYPVQYWVHYSFVISNFVMLAISSMIYSYYFKRIIEDAKT